MDSKPFLIGLTGASGSGKTTFLQQLAAAFAPEQLLIISQDNYYRPREQQKMDENGVANFDLPDAIHLDEFADDINRLMRYESVKREEYTFNNPDIVARQLTFEPRPIVIVEGLFVMYDTKMAEMLDLKVFLHAPETTAFSRRIRRDQIERNYPLEDVLYRYEKHVIPTYEKYIRPLHQQADLVINNYQQFERGLSVLIGFLKNKLR